MAEDPVSRPADAGQPARGYGRCQDTVGQEAAVTLTTVEQNYLADRGHARLATVAPNGAPQNKPVGFRYNAELGTIDIYGIAMESSAKFRNVQVNPDGRPLPLPANVDAIPKGSKIVVARNDAYGCSAARSTMRASSTYPGLL